MTNLKVYLKFMLVAGLVFGLFFGIGSGATNLLTGADKAEPDIAAEEEPVERQEGERTNILVLGIDARPGEDQARSDTMMLVSIDPKLNKAAVISIPRDTEVKIKGSPANKIATANFYGGPELAVSTVEDLLNLEIEHYVMVDFNGFKDIIDTLGGVTITVPQKMYKPSEDIDLKAGTQKLNGRQALAFVRYRDYVMGDIERAAQQQEFVKALAKEILKPATIIKLPKLVKQLNQYVKTDLGLTVMLRMASWAPGFNTDSVVTQTLPGYFYDEFDEYGNLAQSFWVADTDKTANLIDNLFAGKTITVVSESPLPVNPKKTVIKDQPAGEDTEENTADNDENIEENDLDNQRSKLPSVGHSPETTYPVSNINTGPEGYI